MADDFDIQVFYDGDCPLCIREIRMLRRRERGRRVLFTDIASPAFDVTSVAVPWTDLMARIHGRLPDGAIIEGVEVFRRLYSAVGFSAIVAVTRLPGIAQVLNLAYRLFAKNRLRLTGRCMNGACGLHQPVRPRPLTAS